MEDEGEIDMSAFLQNIRGSLESMTKNLERERRKLTNDLKFQETAELREKNLIKLNKALKELEQD